MAAQLTAIEALPGQFAGIAAAFRNATLQLARGSAAAIPNSLLPANILLRGSALETHLFVSRTDNHLLFGFIRLSTQTAVIMDVTVNFRFEIGEPDVRGTVLTPESVLHSAIVPPFFQVGLSDAEIAAAAKVLVCDRKEIFFVRLDTGVLAVVRPEDIQTANVAWRWSPADPWVLSAPLATLMSHADRAWQVPPFLALARTVGLWTKSGFDAGEPLPVTLPAQVDPGSEKTAYYVLRQLTAAWESVVNTLQNRAGDQDEPDPGIARLVPDYQAAGFAAKVMLRLDSNGQLASKGASDDLFQLQAALTLEEDDHGVARSRITIGPPDFLSAGDLYSAFLDTLVASDAALQLASQLGLKGQDAAIRSFISSARSNPLDAPLVFRIKSGKRDSDLITLHGTLNGLLQHVVLKADFTVDRNADPMVQMDVGSMRVLYTDRPQGGAPQDDRGTELVQYFLRLLVNLRNWHRSLT